MMIGRFFFSVAVFSELFLHIAVPRPPVNLFDRPAFGGKSSRPFLLPYLRSVKMIGVEGDLFTV